MNHLNIAVVDDDEDIRGYTKALLEKEGYEIVTMASGDEAIEKIAENDYDVVLTDLMMPGSADGLAVLEAVKKKDCTIPVIIMTAYASIDSAIQAMRMGADDYLCKPFNTEELYLRLEKIGRDKEQREILDGTEQNKAQAMHDLQMMVAKLQHKFNRLEQALTNKNVDMEKRLNKALKILDS